MAFVSATAVPCLRARHSPFVGSPRTPPPAAATAVAPRRTTPARMVALPVVGEVSIADVLTTGVGVAVAVAVGSVILNLVSGLSASLNAPPADPKSAKRAASVEEGVLGLSALKPEPKKTTVVPMKTAPVKRDYTASTLKALEDQAKAMFPKDEPKTTTE